MHLVIIAVLVFALIAWFGLARRNSKIYRAKERLANAKAEKAIHAIDKKAEELLDLINGEIIKQEDKDRDD